MEKIQVKLTINDTDDFQDVPLHDALPVPLYPSGTTWVSVLHCSSGNGAISGNMSSTQVKIVKHS